MLAAPVKGTGVLEGAAASGLGQGMYEGSPEPLWGQGVKKCPAMTPTIPQCHMTQEPHLKDPLRWPRPEQSVPKNKVILDFNPKYKISIIERISI